MVSGSIPSFEVISAPRLDSESAVTVIGRTRACSSPSSTTSRPVSAATAGTKRMTVPASPQSMLIGAVGCARWADDAASLRSIGSMWSTSSSSSMTAPSPRRASIISSVSRLRSQPLRSEPDWARAARMRYRFVSDFEPGTETVAVMPDAAAGACQSPAAGSVSVGMSVNSERTQRLLGGVFDVRPQVLSGMLGPPPQSGAAGGVDTGQKGSAEHGRPLQGALGAGLLLFLRRRLLRGQTLTDGVE